MWPKKYLIIKGLGLRIRYVNKSHLLKLKLGFSNLILRLSNGSDINTQICLNQKCFLAKIWFKPCLEYLVGSQHDFKMLRNVYIAFLLSWVQSLSTIYHLRYPLVCSEASSFLGLSPCFFQILKTLQFSFSRP